MERLSDLSLQAAIALENLLQGRQVSHQPIKDFVTALGADQPDPAERVKNLASDYRRVGLFSQAWHELTGTIPSTLSDLAQSVSDLLGEMRSDAVQTPANVAKARDFCVALNRAFVNVEYESLYAGEHPGLHGRDT